ncbi:MAG: TlpA family protein disulfide reductase [Burkholderiales bacterium]|nr:MAG: TlpA family protein disulfide reductase [Burkholderiales bacterium]
MESQSLPNTEASQKRRKLLFAGAAGAAALAGTGLALWRYRLAEPEDGALAALWALEAELPTGGVYKLSKLKGKPLVVNFWATWCPPCVEEMPLLDAFYRQNASKGWQMVGLAADNAAAVTKFLAKMPMQFPTPLAGLAGIELSRTLGNLTGALPFTVVINSQGEIALRHMGKLSAEQIADFTKIT